MTVNVPHIQILLELIDFFKNLFVSPVLLIKYFTKIRLPISQTETDNDTRLTTFNIHFTVLCSKYHLQIMDIRDDIHFASDL